MRTKSIALGLILFTSITHAESLTEPKGNVLLTVTGVITEHNQANTAVFDYAMLSALKQNHVITETPWNDGKVDFSGPLISDLLATVGANGSDIMASAIDDYSVTIPIAEIQKYPMIIALNMNGKPISVREKGPIRVIYPWSDYPELQQQKYYTRAIWQLSGIKIK